jgi:hypothetical protein
VTTTTSSVGYENKGSSMLEMPPPPSNIVSDSLSHQDVGEDVGAIDIPTGGMQFVSMTEKNEHDAVTQRLRSLTMN